MRDLSPRQREILALVAAGRTSKEIAGQLGISESTVNWHISNVFERLGASSRAEAVAVAMREEAQRPDDPRTVPERRAGPPLPLSAIALAVAVTLVLGLLGGAFMAGWSF
jgi:DNA-binding CsgD family transcriptional regulator